VDEVIFQFHSNHPATSLDLRGDDYVLACLRRVGQAIAGTSTASSCKPLRFGFDRPPGNLYIQAVLTASHRPFVKDLEIIFDDDRARNGLARLDQASKQLTLSLQQQAATMEVLRFRPIPMTLLRLLMPALQNMPRLHEVHLMSESWSSMQIHTCEEAELLVQVARIPSLTCLKLCKTDFYTADAANSFFAGLATSHLTRLLLCDCHIHMDHSAHNMAMSLVSMPRLTELTLSIPWTRLFLSTFKSAVLHHVPQWNGYVCRTRRITTFSPVTTWCRLISVRRYVDCPKSGVATCCADLSGIVNAEPHYHC
jgi:hypothetical protein